MNEIELSNLELKTFIEQDALDYCQLNSINPDNIKKLYLYGNKLTDISGIKIFKNVIYLSLHHNNISNISVLKYLNNLKELNIGNNKVKDISDLKYLNKLKQLILFDNKIKDISVIKYLNKLKKLDIRDLKLESDQIQYINSLKNLNQLWCNKVFKDMLVLNQLNKNIIIRK